MTTKINNSSISGAHMIDSTHPLLNHAFDLTVSRVQDSARVSNKDRNANKNVSVIGEVAGWSQVEKNRAFGVNPNGLAVDLPGKYPINYTKGFATLKDFWTVSHKDDFSLGSIITEYNTILGNRPLVSVDKLYDGMEHGEAFHYVALVDLFLTDGFIRYNTGPGQTTFVKFDSLNLPIEYVYIRHGKKRTRGETLIDGWVVPELYERIYAIVFPQLIKEHVEISLSLLTGYRFHEGNFVGGQTQTQHLSPNMDYCMNSFYPWIDVDLRDYFEEFLSSRANVLILIGPPGTGKSTLIRTMIRDMNLRALLAYKPEVISSSNFITTCQEFLRGSGDGDKERRSAVVVEDADILMEDRKNGNLRMSEVLNATSGIASDTESKFILSTNLASFDDIDPALRREGRCFDILCFRELTAEEATTVRAMRGLPPREFDPKRTYKLASALNSSRVKATVDATVKPRFGFTR